MIVDLHVRVGGPGDISLEELLSAAKAVGLDGVALTPRRKPADVKAARAAAGKAGVAVFFGVELRTDRGAILAFPPGDGEEYTSAPWGEPDEDGYYDYEEIVDPLSDKGYAIVAAQPFDDTINSGIGENIHQLAGLHAIVVAAGTKSHMAHDRALETALAMKVAAVAGTGTCEDVERLGRVGTVFAEVATSQRHFTQQLRRGEAWIAAWGNNVSSGRGGGGRGDRDRGPRGRSRGGRGRRDVGREGQRDGNRNHGNR